MMGPRFQRYNLFKVARLIEANAVFCDRKVCVIIKHKIIYIKSKCGDSIRGFEKLCNSINVVGFKRIKISIFN